MSETRGTASDAVGISHLDGVPWHKAPLPKPRHECWAQTEGFARGKWVSRCACGSIALDLNRFTQKNARRDPHHTVYSGDYYPPRPRLRDRLRARLSRETAWTASN